MVLFTISHRITSDMAPFHPRFQGSSSIRSYRPFLLFFIFIFFLPFLSLAYTRRRATGRNLPSTIHSCRPMSRPSGPFLFRLLWRHNTIVPLPRAALDLLFPTAWTRTSPSSYCQCHHRLLPSQSAFTGTAKILNWTSKLYFLSCTSKLRECKIIHRRGQS